ncbi:MAG TPA: M28 family peptidase [Coriobacteriia bacterium]|nr:M28 family peptidase [Coriobacteriia bacterium]
MAELIDYARTLAEEIGPRPATTDSEHRAAEWLATTFGSYGLETEVHEFDAPRTYAWAYVIYHLLTLLAAFAAGFASFPPFAVWAALAVSAIVAFFLWSDLDTRWGLTRLMPKGPSQNVIARHVPRTRRGERLRRIVVVAHYDSARSSLAFSPGMVGSFPTTFALMKWCTYLTPVMILLMVLPFTASLEPGLWYATMAVAAYLVVPLFINVHRELFMPLVAGANDNASGVAAMLGVMERLVPAPDATSLVTTGSFPQIRRGPAAAEEADVVPEGSLLQYTPAGGDPNALPADFAWADESPAAEARREQGVLDFDTIDFAAVAEESAETPSGSKVEGWNGNATAPTSPARQPVESGEPRGAKGLLGKLGRKKERRENGDVKGWLGVDEDFDARKAGRDIGSWDNFEEKDEDDDGFGWKGGWAGDDPIGDPEFAANEAARIRRRVTEDIDRELTEKEIWFVATGAEEVGTFGMQALLHDFADDLKDALIINIDGCGSGQLHWASAEGMARRYRASQRLVGLARRVSRETDTVIKPRVFRGLSTDATAALARGFKAVSIMAFDSNGLPVNWHWKTDTVDQLDPELMEKTAEFVAAMVRDA